MYPMRELIYAILPLPVGLVAALAAFFLIGPVLRRRDAAHGPRLHPQSYRVYKPFRGRRGQFAMSMFFLAAGLTGLLLFLPDMPDWQRIDALVVASLFLLPGLIFLLRFAAIARWQFEVNGTDIARRRFLRRPRHYDMDAVIQVMTSTAGSATVYGIEGGRRSRFFRFDLGRPAQDEASAVFLQALSQRADAVLATERRKQQGVAI